MLEIGVINAAIVRQRVMVLLFKIRTNAGSKLCDASTYETHYRLQSTQGSEKQMLKARYISGAFCKTGIDPEGLTRVILKPKPSAVIAKENAQQNLKENFQINASSIRQVLKEKKYLDFSHMIEC